jgi:predicted phosphodiesterase
VGEWPYLIQEEFEEVRLSFVHYGLDESQQNFASFVNDPDVVDLNKLFAGLRSDVVFYGHNHLFSDLEGVARYVNPGSLGCHTKPIARFAVLECRRKSYELRMCHTPYDDSDLFDQFESRGVPERHFIYQAFFGGRYPHHHAGPHIL